jgi:hypothetical protein
VGIIAPSQHLSRHRARSEANCSTSCTVRRLTRRHRARRVICFTLLPITPAYYPSMRGGFLIAVLTLLALSAIGGHSHFMLRPTAPIPAVNVP